MEIFVNDSVKFTLNTNIDISGYSDLRIRYRKPDGDVGCWTATLCPSNNNCLYYQTSVGDIDQAGDWTIQALVLDTGVQLTGLWVNFTVLSALGLCTTAAPTTAP